ncbi:polysaccharide biosynthesis tyrosine autokinase [bacterium]|nr:polysaccharide biosynthesis tyrosine autokinase [bacterium]
MLRRKWLVLQAFIVIFATAVITSFLMPPVYENSASVFIGRAEATSSLLSDLGMDNFARSSDSEIMENYLELATMSPILEKLIIKLQLRNSDGIYLKPKKILSRFPIISSIFPRPYLDIELTSDTADLLEITSMASDPETAAMIANTTAEILIDENFKQQKKEYKDVRQYVESQIAATKKDYLKVLLETKDFQQKNHVLNLGEEVKNALTKLTQLLTRKESINQQLDEIKAKIRIYHALFEKRPNVISSSVTQEYGYIEELKKSITDLNIKLAEVRTEKHAKHPDVILLTKKLTVLQTELKEEYANYQLTARDLEVLENNLAASEAAFKAVNTDIQNFEMVLAAYPGKIYQNSQQNLQLATTQSNYSKLLATLHEIGVAEAMTLSDIRMVETATVKSIDKPDSPSKVLNAFIGGFLGLFFGVFLAFFVDHFDDSIRTAEDIRKSNLTYFGSIIKFKTKTNPLIINKNPKSPIYESYRTIRNGIKFATVDTPIKSIIITSPTANEGKSITCANLGISMAKDGKNVLIIDCDLREPSLHDLFKINNNSGLTTLLANEKKLPEVIQASPVDGLNILTSGPIPPDPGFLLESEKMQRIFSECAEKFDYLLFDTPPILEAQDATVLARQTDACLLLLEAGKTTFQMLSHSIENFNQANIQISGVILNKFKP